MPIRIVRLGEPRAKGEGLRFGTVRRPPRGVPKVEFAKRDYYDVWLPNLAPSEALMKEGQAAQTEAQWKAFARRYTAEMKDPTVRTCSTRWPRSRTTRRSPLVVIAKTRIAATAPCCAASWPSGAQPSSEGLMK